MTLPTSSRRTAAERRGVVPRPIGLERFRSHTADGGDRDRLAHAVASFDALVATARSHSITDRPEVRVAFGAAVDAIARAIQRLPQGSRSGEEVEWVLVDRAAARFTSRVLGSAIGRRPSPTHVASALDEVREVVAAWT